MNFNFEAQKHLNKIRYRSSWDGVGMWLELEVPNPFNIMTIPISILNIQAYVTHGHLAFQMICLLKLIIEGGKC